MIHTWKKIHLFYLCLNIFHKEIPTVDFDSVQGQLSSKLQRIYDKIVTGEETDHLCKLFLLVDFLFGLVRGDVVHGEVHAQRGPHGAVGVVREALDVRGRRVEQYAGLGGGARMGWRRGLRGGARCPDAAALLGQLLHLHQDGVVLCRRAGDTRLQLELHLSLFQSKSRT